MDTIISFWRSIIGQPVEPISTGNYNYSWDYGEILEYMFAGLAVLVVIGLVFRLLFTIIGFFSPKR